MGELTMTSSIQRSWFAPLLVLGLAWPQERGADPDLSSAESDQARPFQQETVSGDDLAAHPAEYIGQTVLVTVQIRNQLTSWNPMVTRFGDGEYSAWAAWSDEQFPWAEDDFHSPRMRLFARHDSAAEWALFGVEPYSRFTLTCRVRSVFANMPWLEVVAVKPHVRHLGEGSLIHATRGLEFMASGAFEAAISEFERASAGGIPELAKIEFKRLIEACRGKLPPPTYERYVPAGSDE